MADIHRQHVWKSLTSIMEWIELWKKCKRFTIYCWTFAGWQCVSWFAICVTVNFGDCGVLRITSTVVHTYIYTHTHAHTHISISFRSSSNRNVAIRGNFPHLNGPGIVCWLNSIGSSALWLSISTNVASGLLFIRIPLLRVWWRPGIAAIYCVYGHVSKWSEII